MVSLIKVRKFNEKLSLIINKSGVYSNFLIKHIDNVVALLVFLKSRVDDLHKK